MSDMPADCRASLGRRTVVAEMDRKQDETRKFVSGQHKLAALDQKPSSEGRKLDRDRSLAPWVIVLSALSELVVAPISGGVVGAIVERSWP